MLRRADDRRADALAGIDDSEPSPLRLLPDFAAEIRTQVTEGACFSIVNVLRDSAREEDSVHRRDGG